MVSEKTVRGLLCSIVCVMTHYSFVRTLTWSDTGW